MRISCNPLYILETIHADMRTQMCVYLYISGVYVYGSLVMLITAVALQLSGRRVWVKDDSVCGKDTVRIKDVKTGQLHLRM